MDEEVSFVDPQEQFQNFFKLEKYRQQISRMSISNGVSIVVDFTDLQDTDSALAEIFVEKPDEYLEIANQAALVQLRIEDPEYAEKLEARKEKVKVRFKGLPATVPLRALGSEQIGKLVMINGIIVRASPARPMAVQAAFKCKRCGTIMYVEQAGPFLKIPAECTETSCMRRGPFDFVEEESSFVDSQEIRIQERPEDLPPGQLPRWVDVQLVGKDLIDVGRPGDQVVIVGAVRAEAPTVPGVGKLRTFTLNIDANFIDITSKEPEAVQISLEEEKQILELSKDPLIHQKIIRSIAPSIYGYEHIKEAIMYLLFGGVMKQLPDITIRGEINVLLIGDPGTAKSQLLQYVSKIAPRGLYTSGRGTTAAGLTAAVIREKQGGMTLEAGALVLADKGVACIDEMDKMRPDDRVAIHEALEQHTVSVAKGGIVATLNARAAVLAAANPSLGRYDAYRNITDNINLPVTLLSRFDLLFIMRDTPEPDSDGRMSDHILTLHRMKAPPEEPPFLPELLRKYIAYAKRIDPVLTEEAAADVRQYYLKMRAMSGSTESPVAITPRQLEGLVRLSEARAKSFLRDRVEVEDTRAIIRLMTLSLQDVGIDTTTGKIDIDVIMTGKPKSLRDKMQVVLSTFADLEKQLGIVEDSTLYQALSRKVDITDDDARRLVEQLVREGILYSPKPGHLKRTAA